MSDVAPGTMSLEDDALAPEPEPQAPPAPEPPAPEAVAPQNADDAEPEGVIVNPGGEKLVPLSALAAARQAAREAKAEAAALKPKAERVDQIVAEWNAAQPLLQRAMQQQQAPPPPAPAPKGPLSDQDAIEYAKDLDLYKADGTPDTDRAQRLAARQQKIAESQAQQYVQPLMQHNAQQQSAFNFEKVAAFKDNSGIVVDRGILQQFWSAVPPEMSAKPEIAAVLYRQALAEMVLQGKIKPGQTIVAPPPPQITESIGGGAPARREPDAIERGFMQAAGIKPKDYEAMSARFKPGQRNSLED